MFAYPPSSPVCRVFNFFSFFSGWVEMMVVVGRGVCVEMMMLSVLKSATRLF